MKATKRWIIFLFTAVILLTSIPVSAFTPPAAAQETLQNGYASDDKYAIYPIPQSIDYSDSGEFQLETDVTVISESGIDEYTNAFLDEILDNYQRTKKTNQTAGSGSQILLGIQGSGGAADTYANSIRLNDETLFTKTDSYLLSAKDGVIVILGRDTNAVFYGLATLQMMFSSFAGTKFLNVQIEDYAVMKMRGFIEGFYGGWDYEGRESLMRFARDLKMNTYIYASKADNYHKNDELYPNSEIQQIERLVKVGNETKVEYCWSIHISFFFNSLSGTPGQTAYETAFEAKYTKLRAKFQQLYDAGVRKFSVLNDDFGSGSHTEVVRLLNRLDDDLSDMGCEPLSYCMQGYNEGWSNTTELTAMQDLNSDIALFWTGSGVNSPITQTTVDFLKEKTNHEAIFWLNYPVNEHAKSGLYLGNITHYARDGVTGLAGAVSNPCWFTEANKVGLFQLAALFWNNNNYLEHADEVWENSFKYLQPEVYDAYLTIARNVSNCPNSSRVPAGFPESEYIKDELDAVSLRIQQGRSLAGDENVQRLLEEFSNIQNAIDLFRAECTNDTLVANLDLWMKSLKDIAEAGEAALLALCAIEESDADTAWKYLAVAGAKMATQNSYTYIEPSQQAVTTALAGSKRLAPFVTKAITAIKTRLIPFLNPSLEIPPTFYAVLAGTDQGSSAEAAKALDGNELSFAQFDQNQKADDYFGVDMGKTVSIQTIDILQASSDTDIDFFHNAILEYSTDADNWTAIETYENDSAPRHILKEDLEIEARFIRLRLTKTGTTGGSGTDDKASYWTHIREITINGGIQKEETYGLYASEGIEGTVTLSGLTYHLSQEGSISLRPGEYIGIRMKELSGIKEASLDASSVSELSFQYSVNSILWDDVPSAPNSEAARYIRLYNGTDHTVDFTLTDLSVTVFGNAVNLSVADRSPELSTIREGAIENLFDGKKDTFVFFESSQKNGHEIIIDFGTETQVYDVTITQATGNPKFYNAAFYLSTDKTNWGEPIMTVAESNGVYTSEYRTEADGYIKMSRSGMEGYRARYLRILITKDSGYRLKINEIEINKTIDTADEAIKKIMTNSLTGNLDAMIDGDISTAYISAEQSDGTAYIKYPLTENTRLTSVTFLQNAADITNAKVTAEIYDGSSIREETLGTLSEGSSMFYFKGVEDVLSLTVTWPEQTTPALYEIITNTGENVNTITLTDGSSPEKTLICAEGRSIRLPENTAQKQGYLFRGWNDGTKLIAAGTRYVMGQTDVTLSAEWERIPISSITVTPDTAELKVGDSIQLAAAIAPEEALPDLTWTSDHPDIAFVDTNGQVTARTKGTACITASATNDSGISGSCTITVTDTAGTAKPPANGTVTNPDATNPTVTDPDATNPTVTDPTAQENKIYVKNGHSFKVTSTKNATVTYTGTKTKSKKISIPDNVVINQKTYQVTAIYASAFKNNKTITEITIGKNVEEIGKNAFSGCKKLKKITIKSTRLKKISSKAFYGCKVLKSITINSKKLTKIEKNAFGGIHKNAVIKVPASRLTKYKKLIQKSGWKKASAIRKK